MIHQLIYPRTFRKSSAGTSISIQTFAALFSQPLNNFLSQSTKKIFPIFYLFCSAQFYYFKLRLEDTEFSFVKTKY